MDTTEKLKLSLISRIKESKDLDFLNALQNIVDSTDQEIYQLSELQESSIKHGRSNIRNGKFHKNEDVISEMKEWLKNK